MAITKKMLFIDPPGWQGAVYGNPAFPNVGIAYLIPPLQKAGWELHVLDMNNISFSQDDVLAKIENWDPTVVAFSCKTATFEAARNLAVYIKNRFPHVKTIFGGAHITLNYETLLASSGDFADGLFAGEGEADLAAFAEYVLDSSAVPDFRSGKLLQASSPVVFCQERKLDLDTLDFPDYSLFPQNVQEHNKENYPLITSRGCPYCCIYCTVPLINGSQWRARRVDSIVKELAQCKRNNGVTKFQIIDDSWNVQMDRCKAMCQTLLDQKLSFQWFCPNGIRADRLDENLVALMKDSGCYFVAVGVESGSEIVFPGINKGSSLEKISRGIHLLQRAGIPVSGFFIIGLPGSTWQEEVKSVDFAQQHGIFAHFNILTPYKHTRVFELVTQKGQFLKPVEGSLHFTNDFRKIQTTFQWPNFSAKKMRQAFIYANLRLLQYHMLLPPMGRLKSGIVLLYLYLRYAPHELPAFLGRAFRRLEENR